MEHEYSIEILYHFTCNNCKNWWSYTSTPSRYSSALRFLPEDKVVSCFHCGHKATMKVKDGMYDE